MKVKSIGIQHVARLGAIVCGVLGLLPLFIEAIPGATRMMPFGIDPWWMVLDELVPRPMMLLFPILSAAGGALQGAIYAVFANLLLRLMGGIEVEVEG